ncbi:NUDIX domain-containing protein [Candidatus Vampirococcus lugosii]|uniref:ADP-ribose pyrophosphatase YjhB, NUDIX family n=1 Tax=Candidatus Vampirococcus lugosii TaxID=2789015 RepID=A0ABS5QLS9_9BACT|nr:NUDIX domain-containing protein [Candidatus Vampirococcus lugosii]MBS8122145.1 ADP-ribose pyrophosphatase YjhB, NUDIX family [Candidatus Vampirococcus lugosii]
MSIVLKSAGGIIYYFDKKDGTPKFFLVKRHALSGKIERVAPKGKIEKNEKDIDTVVREIKEEVGIYSQNIKVKSYLGSVLINLRNTGKGSYDKKISYYLVEYFGDFSDIKIENVEGYLGYHKWATIQEISGLIYYENLRHIFMSAYNKIMGNSI